MTAYLTIDIGNTMCKALAWRDSEPVGETLHGKIDAIDVEHLAASVDGLFDYAAVCSVTGDRNGVVDAARACSRQMLEINVDTPSPISLAAYSGRTLGADRIAALAGARSLVPEGELLVVDCGTAVTYDRLSADNRFLGGNIAPGIGMRLRALARFTSRLPEVPTLVSETVFGTSTESAMQAGAFGGVLAETEYYLRKCPERTTVVVTGGRGKDIIDKLPFCVVYDPDLVLRGLKYLIDYNRK